MICYIILIIIIIIAITATTIGSDRLQSIDSQINTLQKQQQDVKARWELERAGMLPSFIRHSF